MAVCAFSWNHFIDLVVLRRKTGPWIILGFSVFQNIPMAVMYTIRYNRCKSFLEIHGKLTEELHLLKNQHLGRKI